MRPDTSGERRRVVVTGRGLICPLGDEPAEVYEALLAGRSGLGPVELFPTEKLGTPAPPVGEVRGFDPARYLGQGNFRPLDRTARLATVAAHRALLDSGWRREKEAGDGGAAEDEDGGVALGLILGTVFGSVRTIAEFDRRALEAGPIYAKPMDFANSVINAAAGQTAIWHRLPGINSTLSCGGVSGLQAIGYGAEMIAGGRADALLTGGAEELCFESLFGYARTGRLARERPVPFDARRDGFALGEGAALLMLEDEQTARRRGARVLAQVLAYRSGFDPGRGADDEGAVATLAAVIRRALDDAGLAPRHLVAVSTSASGSPDGDRREAAAIARVLEERPGVVVRPVTAVKSALGDSLGAAGAFQTWVLLESLAAGRLPGIAGLQEAEPALPLAVTAEAQSVAPGPCLVTALGFDGHAGALLIAPTTEPRQTG